MSYWPGVTLDAAEQHYDKKITHILYVKKCIKIPRLHVNFMIDSFIALLIIRPSVTEQIDSSLLISSQV